MSDDPETARQIAELSRDSRPLLVVDVDEVVLDFVDPFSRFLNSQGFDLLTDSFRIHGNVVALDDGKAIEAESVAALMTAFFDAQETWQTAAAGAVDTLGSLAPRLEIVLLSAMPHRHRPVRRALLDRLSLPYPLVSTEAAKGPAVSMIRGGHERPVGFIDDIPRNLESVARSVPDAALFHLMSHQGFRALLPPLPSGAVVLRDWSEAGARIAKELGVSQST
jgi:hypothetical protein